MNKKTFYNPILAAGYIAFIGTLMNWVTHIAHPPQDNIFMPMSVLALLVLSVAVMAYLFFYQPVLLLLEGKRPEAVRLFFSTVIIFAVIVVIFVILALFIIP